MPALKDVPYVSVLTVVILAVTCQQTLHHPPDALDLTFDQQVNVVRHQAVGVKKEPAGRLLLCEKSEELLMIGLRVKDILPVIPPRDHMV